MSNAMPKTIKLFLGQTAIHDLHKSVAVYNTSRVAIQPSRCIHKTRCLNVKSSDDNNTPSKDKAISGTSATYIDGLYKKWLLNPTSVDASWNEFFSGKSRKMPTSSFTIKVKPVDLTKQLPLPAQGISSLPPPSSSSSSTSTSLSPPASTKKSTPSTSSNTRKPQTRPASSSVASRVRPITTTPNIQSAAAAAAAAAASPDWKYIDDHLTVQAIIRAYQTRGHLAADLDPLGIVSQKTQITQDGIRRIATEAVLRQHFSYLFGESNMGTQYKLPSSTMIGGDQPTLPLNEILERLERVYCGKIGIEYMQMTNLEKTNWIRERFEVPGVINFSAEEKRLIYKRLLYTTGFENFLAKKFASEKRFGLEGCDVMIPIIKEIIDRSTEMGIDSVLIGMAHRGRLNVLANICKKPISDILSQFHGLKASDSGSGDVKYHLGTFVQRLNTQTNKNVKITVVANPSHLEHVNPVLLGKTRAEMFFRGDSSGNYTLPIIIHGDASFCGQGIVFECIHLSNLPNFTTFGTIHIVSNNQVGFTTDPRFSRSSRYCTDVARVLNVPILHVNADDPELNIHCARVAADWRAKYHQDVVIDIVGYRRNGHNEADEPMFTQPLMYQRIRKHKPVLTMYGEKLVEENVLTRDDIKTWGEKYILDCEKAWDESQKMESFKYSSWIDSPWTGFFEGRDLLKVCPTGVNMKTLNRIGHVFSSPPPVEANFVIHKGIERMLRLREQMVKSRMADWALGEAFAIGSLLKEGIHVRLSGQDVERGTFSHRHHVYHHQTKDKTQYNCMHHLYPDQAVYSVSNSSLSENAILGFEHGYSMTSPQTVVIWEGQFGDFCNTAQTIIDTFISSGESKWVRQSGLVMLLPHSMEGMGPEHSSGRIERFLQLSHDDPDSYPDTDDPDFVARQLLDINWFITNCTTPANFFHVLRRQVKLQFRKPLINFSPKSLLRHPEARSPFRDFDECSSFKRLIPEIGPAAKTPECVKKVVFCSGKVYYDLKKERIDHEQEDEIALIRIEQICPFPYDLVTEQICMYPKAELVWAQEEHKNQGAWPYVQPRFDTALIKMETESRCIAYHGRAPSSAPATGNKVRFYKEYNDFMTSIFGKLTDENKKRLERIKKAEQAAAKAQAQSQALAKPKKKDGKKPEKKK